MNTLIVKNSKKTLQFKITDVQFFCEQEIKSDWKTQLQEEDIELTWNLEILTEPLSDNFKEKYEEVFGHWVSPNPTIYFRAIEDFPAFPSNKDFETLELKLADNNYITDKYLGSNDGYFPNSINDQIAFTNNDHKLHFYWTGNTRYFMDEDFEKDEKIDWQKLKNDEWHFELKANTIQPQWKFKMYNTPGKEGINLLKKFAQTTYPNHTFSILKEEVYENFAKITYNKIMPNS